MSKPTKRDNSSSHEPTDLMTSLERLAEEEIPPSLRAAAQRQMTRIKLGVFPS